MIGFQSNLIGMYIFLKLLGMNHASIYPKSPKKGRLHLLRTLSCIFFLITISSLTFYKDQTALIIFLSAITAVQGIFYIISYCRHGNMIQTERHVKNLFLYAWRSLQVVYF